MEHCGPTSERSDPPLLLVSQAPEYPLLEGAALGFGCSLWVYFPSGGGSLGMQVGQDLIFPGRGLASSPASSPPPPSGEET